jgi:hypothetical protein
VRGDIPAAALRVKAECKTRTHEARKVESKFEKYRKRRGPRLAKK